MKTLYTLFLLVAVSFASMAQPKGNLVIIGGGKKTPQIMNKIIELAGGTQAKIVIFPMASGYADEACQKDSWEFTSQGAKNVFCLNITRAQADGEQILKQLEGVTGVYFSGGDQSKLAAELLGSKVLERIREIYLTGGVIAGTSAGASIMSNVMITGNELKHKDSTTVFVTIQEKNVETAKGFAFLPQAIVDQHFIVRKRHNRLMSLVIEHPELYGIGIDEEAAIWVDPNDKLTVLGNYQVIIYEVDKDTLLQVNSLGQQGVLSMKVHILLPEDTFQLTNK